MSISRRNFLIGTAAASVLAPRSVRAAKGSVDNMIVVIAKGGWDTTFCLDPKWGSGFVDGPEVDATAHPDDIDELRPWQNGFLLFNDYKRGAVTEFFTDYAEKTAILRGMWTGSIVHQPCRIRLLTGTTASTNPDFATIVGFEKGGDLPLGSIDFSGLGYPGHLAASTGSVGHRSQLKALLDPNAMFKAPSWADYELPLFQPTAAEDAAIRGLIEASADDFLAARTDSGGHNDRRIADLYASMLRRDRLLDQGAEMGADLPLGDEPSFSLQAALAVDLIGKGLCRTVTLQHFMSWDTHKSNVLQHERNQEFFGVINSMLADLQTRSLLDRTLVVICSEMARTPRRNVGLGKDHWGHTSQILVGGGVKPGIYGGTDDRTESLSVDYPSGETTPNGEVFKYDNFVAGVLAHMDVDPDKYLKAVTPFTAASQR
jgi:hypothetical protein